MTHPQPQVPTTKKHRYRLVCWLVQPIIDDSGQVVGQNGEFMVVDTQRDTPISESKDAVLIEQQLINSLKDKMPGPYKLSILTWTKYEEAGILLPNNHGGLLVPSR